MALLTKVPWHFVDENEDSITSYERVQELIGKGFLFEACAVQSMVLESMLFYLIILKASNKPPIDRKKIRKKLSNKNLGGLNKICKNHELFSLQFIDRLKLYTKKRNLLVHRHLEEKIKFDYDRFIEEGNFLIEKLIGEIRPRMKKILSEKGISGADKWSS